MTCRRLTNRSRSLFAISCEDGEDHDFCHVRVRSTVCCRLLGRCRRRYGIVTLIAVAVLFAVNAIGGNVTSIFEKLAAAFTN